MVYIMIYSIYVTDVNHSLQIDLNFWNKQNHAYQYFNVTGVRDKKKTQASHQPI